MSIPYVGITGFRNQEEVANMLSVFNESYPEGTHRLHVGVMTGYTKIHGISTKFSDSFVCVDDIAGIFSNTAHNVMNCLHYADFRNREFRNTLEQAIYYGGEHLHAIQLDMLWPDPDIIQTAIQATGKKLEVILQIGRTAFDTLYNNPSRIVGSLIKYDGLITHVLIDKSMGKGIAMDPYELLPHLRAIRARFPSLHLVIAGGLGPDTMGLLVPIRREFADISCDAEGRLRLNGDNIDPINRELATRYIINSSGVK
jgi:hypothetical protein